MNNPKSMLLGWGALILAAGGGYYFAKKDINERRREQAAAGARPPELLTWQDRIAAASTSPDSKHGSDSTKTTGSASVDRGPSQAR